MYANHIWRHRVQGRSLPAGVHAVCQCQSIPNCMYAKIKRVRDTRTHAVRRARVHCAPHTRTQHNAAALPYTSARPQQASATKASRSLSRSPCMQCRSSVPSSSRMARLPTPDNPGLLWFLPIHITSATGVNGTPSGDPGHSQPYPYARHAQPS